MQTPVSETGTIAIIGLGNMGRGMAGTLQAAGFRVLGVDPHAPADSVPDIVRTSLALAVEEADVLLLSLPGSAVSRAVLIEAGLTARGVPHRLVVDTSTADPLITRELTAQLAEAGHSLVDAPVSGGPSGAAAGALTVFLGGHDDAVAEAAPVLEAIAARVTHVGGPSAGAVAKLVNNMLVAVHLQVAGEALALVEAAGMEPEAVLAAINASSGRSGVTELNLPRWVLSGTFDSGFSTGLMSRDITLAVSAAEDMGAQLPLAAQSAHGWRALGEEDPREDFNRMADTGRYREQRRTR